MKLECTKKLLEYLGKKPEKMTETVDPLFGWTANLIMVNRRKTLVAVHMESRCMFVIHGLTVKSLSKLPELIFEGIRTLLKSEYVRTEVIERYLDDCGRTMCFSANSSRSVVAWCNKACERVKLFSDLFVPGDLFQQHVLPELNYDIIRNENYIFTHEMLIESLRKRYGEDIQSCRALELEAELELHTPCKRRILVPDNLTFYQFHEVLQGVFEWRNGHLHQFVLERDGFGRPMKILQPGNQEDDYSDMFEIESLDSLHITLSEVFRIYGSMDYEYDFGDGWYHVIKLCRVIEDCREPFPRCIQAIGDAPMEDCGGADGFAEITAILNDPSHPEHRQISDWVRSSWWQPLNVERMNDRIKDAYRRSAPMYY